MIQAKKTQTLIWAQVQDRALSLGSLIVHTGILTEY